MLKAGTMEIYYNDGNNIPLLIMIMSVTDITDKISVHDDLNYNDINGRDSNNDNNNFYNKEVMKWES